MNWYDVLPPPRSLRLIATPVTGNISLPCCTSSPHWSKTSFMLCEFVMNFTFSPLLFISTKTTYLSLFFLAWSLMSVVSMLL